MSEQALTIQSLRTATELAPDHVLVVPYFDNDDLADSSTIVQIGGAELGKIRQGSELSSRRYRTTFIRPRDSAPGLLFVGAGAREDFDLLSQLRVAGAGARYLARIGYRRIAFAGRGNLSEFDWGRAAVEGAIVGVYDVGLLKTKRKPAQLDDVTVIGGPDVQRGAELGRIIGESKNVARDLVNLPPNEITPAKLAARAESLAQSAGLEIAVLGPEEMRRLGMGSLLGVAAGSHEEPRLIILSYGPKTAARSLAVVGKGITFDSGGLSLKPPQAMETMKSDMSGAAAVIGSLLAVARLRPEGIRVTGYVGATENMPGGGAMRPGDVLTAMNGETIEVLNTDAEGRLVLADVLSYAIQQGEKRIVDFATLTGSAVVALGHSATLAAARPAAWGESVVRAASAAAELAWLMPLYEDYRRAMDSQIADIKNSGGRAAGALTASAFLSDFAKGADWTHMDIAGTAFREKAESYADSGATAVGVGTVVSLVRDMAG